MTTKTTKKTWIRPEAQAVFETTLNAAFDFVPVRASSPQGRGHLHAQFAQRLERLRALPRRSRRALERAWKKPLAAIALLLTLGQGTALAATINVDSGALAAAIGDGKCSIQEAVANANADAAASSDCVVGSGADEIVLPANGRFSLEPLPKEYGDLIPTVTSKIVIEGRGSTISISQGTLFRISEAGDLTISDAVLRPSLPPAYEFGLENEGTLTLLRSTVTRFVRGIRNDGGTVSLDHTTVADNRRYMYEHCVGIGNYAGTVTLTQSIVSNNYSGRGGGGLCSYGGELTITDSVVSNNGSDVYEGGAGGGILIEEGDLTLVRSRVTGNLSTGGGGIAILARASAHILDSTIDDNRVLDDYSGDFAEGAGILNGGKLVVQNSTIAHNQAVGLGGGISNHGELTISNSTLSANSAVAISGSLFEPLEATGSGIFNGQTASLSMTGVTIVGNTAGQGGGLFNKGSATIKRSLVAGNAGQGREINNQGGTVAVDGFNLIGRNGASGVIGVTLGATDIVPTKPLSGILLPLAHNSSKTKTHALAMNSSALNASPADDGCPAKDQRGAARPQGAGCDIGAFEGSAVMCNGVVSTHVGTSGNDSIYGTPGPDVIAGLSGNDTLQGLDGDDMICGGSGKDSLIGGKGVDALMGDAGDDVLRGQAGDDIVNGGPGTDKCDGGTNGAAGDVAAQCESVVNVP